MQCKRRDSRVHKTVSGSSGIFLFESYRSAFFRSASILKLISYRTAAKVSCLKIATSQMTS